MTEPKSGLDVDSYDHYLDCASILCNVIFTQFCVTTVFFYDWGGLICCYPLLDGQ